MSDGVHIDAERQYAALDATWELAALLRAAIDSTQVIKPGDTEDESGYVMRGLLARMLQLNEAVMAVIGDDTGFSTRELHRAVSAQLSAPCKH